MREVFLALSILILCNMWGSAQTVDVAAKLGHPQMIVYNGKIVTMDDASFESRVGTIVPAMAIRDEKILAVGSDAEIRALAGPQTRQIDLKGRTILPSFFLTHEHPTDWAFMDPEAMKRVFPQDNDFLIVRWLNGTAQEQFAQWETVLKEAVAKAKPGQWIWLSFIWGPNYEYAEEIFKTFPKVVTKERLDQLAPNNPVLVKKHWPLDIAQNSKALEEIRKEYTEWPEGPEKLLTPDRLIEPDVIFKGRTPLLAELFKAELELWAAHGVTAFASSTYTYHNFQALSYLDRKGEMPARFAWGYTGLNRHLDTLRYIAGLVGQGSDYLWNVGAWGATGGSCSTAPAGPQVKGREKCNLAPGSPGRSILEDIIRSGGRIATMHTGGDKDIDYFLDAVGKASREAGLSIEEIRAKRHVFDHSTLAPRPDQIPIIKNLGMIVSIMNTSMWENHFDFNTSAIARDYGVEYTSWSMPRKSVTQAGVMNTFEIDRPIPHKLFLLIQKGITRYNDKDKRVYGPGEKTDRIIQLKALTTWGSYHVLRENSLGSLEPGKLADFIVLDRDYLTIPEDDIPNVKVLMTVVGGKTVHLMPALGREIGMPPVGPATWETKPLENYFAR